MTQREIMRSVACLGTDTKYLVGYLDHWSRSPGEEGQKLLPEVGAALDSLEKEVGFLKQVFLPSESHQQSDTDSAHG